MTVHSSRLVQIDERRSLRVRLVGGSGSLDLELTALKPCDGGLEAEVGRVRVPFDCVDQVVAVLASVREDAEALFAAQRKPRKRLEPPAEPKPKRGYWDAYRDQKGSEF